MRKSEHFNLNLVEGTDIVNPLVQDVPNYEAIDGAMYGNMVRGVGVATELKTGSVHAINRTVKDAAMFRFTATSDFVAGDTFTVDGVQVTAKLASGEQLGDGSFVINSEVLAVLVGTLLTLFVPTGKVTVASDSDKLGGKEPVYYATASALQAVKDTAEGAGTVATNALNRTIGVAVGERETTYDDDAKLVCRKIGNLVVGMYFNGSARQHTQGTRYVIAKSLPIPNTSNRSMECLGTLNYSYDVNAQMFNVNPDGTLSFYSSKNGNYGCMCQFCYECVD